MVFQVEVRCYFRWKCDDKIAMIQPFPKNIFKIIIVRLSFRYRVRPNNETPLPQFDIGLYPLSARQRDPSVQCFSFSFSVIFEDFDSQDLK